LETGVSMNRRILGLCLVTLVVSGALSFLFLKVSFITYPASIQAQAIEHLIRILFSIGGAIFGLVMVLFFYVLIFFRRRHGETGDGAAFTGHTQLEMVWTLVPLTIVLVLGVYGTIVLQNIGAPPANGRESNVNVTAIQWGWLFDYPDYDVRSPELHLIVDQSVLLSMQSKDVIHAFWVPAFGPQKDIVPGMTTELRFTPNIVGKYTLQCNELCGMGHTYMTAPVYVTSAVDFQTWVSQQPKVTPTPKATAAP
jgi:cytochrome c oxidase subunit 2